MAKLTNEDGPVFGIHFFDWYNAGVDDIKEEQKKWTFQIQYEQIGIDSHKVGTDVESYVKQFEVMRETGFDFLLYEWHGSPWQKHHKSIEHPNEYFYEGLKKAGMKASMFYDLEIRFSSQQNYVSPIKPFIETIVKDVKSYFEKIPKELIAKDRNNRTPIVFYAYQFNRNNKNKEDWHDFYDSVIKGIEEAIGEEIVIYWTCGYNDFPIPQLTYAFQHFEKIKPYPFTMGERQNVANVDSATFLIHYDCTGVQYDRGHAFIVQDVRLLEDQLSLVKNTNPSFVFFYGWDEFYEGEHLVPSEEWGTHKLELTKALISEMKKGCRKNYKTALIITDDMLGKLNSNTENLINKEDGILVDSLRTIFPVNDTVVSDRWDKKLLQKHDFVVSLNFMKDHEEMKTFAESSKVVFNFDPLNMTIPSLRDKFENTDFYEANYEKMRNLFGRHLKLYETGLHIGSYTRVYPGWVVEDCFGTRPCVVEPAEIPCDKIRFVASKAIGEHKVRLPIGNIKEIRFIRGEERKIFSFDGRIDLRYPEIIEVIK